MNGRLVGGFILVALAAFGLGYSLASGDRDEARAPAIEFDDPAAALAEIVVLSDPRERARQLIELLDATHPSNGLIVHEALIELRKTVTHDELTEILVASWWAEAAPEIAFAHPLDPPWPDRHPWARTVLEHWAAQDPAAAAIAAQAMPAGPGGGRSEAARAVVDAWLALETIPDPTPLFGVLAQLEPIARGGALHHVAKSLVESRGVDDALEFIRSVPPDDDLRGSVQQELLARTGVALLEIDPALATDWAAEHSATPAGPGIHKHIAYYWALREGSPALEWALALPQSPGKAMIVKRAWISFSRKHREDARTWLLENPPHPLVKGAYRSLVREMAQTDPEAGLALAESAADPSLRDDLRAAAAEGWMALDPKAANTWLAKSGLPADLVARVRKAAREAQTRKPS